MLIPSIFAKAFIIGLTGAMAPGPLLTQTINRTARSGLLTAPLIVLGHGILEFVLILTLLFGFSRVLANPMVAGYIGLVGGLVLLWMGYDIIKNTLQGNFSINTELDHKEEDADKSEISSFNTGSIITGIVVSGSNPYFLLWWATTGLVLFNDSTKVLGRGGPFVFYSGHILSDLSWYVIIGLMVVKGKNIIPEKVYRGVLVLCGLFLIFFSAKFIMGGIKAIF